MKMKKIKTNLKIIDRNHISVSMFLDSPDDEKEQNFSNLIDKTFRDFWSVFDIVKEPVSLLVNGVKSIRITVYLSRRK